MHVLSNSDSDDTYTFSMQRHSEGGPQPRGGGSPENAKDSGFWNPPAPPSWGSGGPLDPPGSPLARTLLAFRLQRAFTEKMFPKTSLPCGRSGSKFAGQDGGSKGGPQTIFDGDTEAISKPCTAAAADAVREEARFLDRAPRPVMT